MQRKVKREKANRVLEYQIPPRVINCFWLAVIVVFSSFLFVWNAEAIPLTSDANILPFLEWMKTQYFWVAYVSILLVWAILYMLFGNLFASFCVVEVMTLILGIVNKTVMMTRKQYVMVADFKVLKEAAKVKIEFASIYEPLWLVLIIIGLFVGMLLYIVYCKRIVRPKKNGAKGWSFRICMASACVIVYVCIYMLHPMEVLLYEINPFTKTGGVIWLSQSFFDNTSKDVPLEVVEEVYDKFEKMTGQEETVFSERKPNIIVIMSEAFWNLDYMQGHIEMSKNPMDAYHALEEKGIAGQVAVNVYGGGTNTTEFEFLTGLNALNFRNMTDYYGVLYTKEQDSFAAYMKNMGYYTMALHPNVGDFYKRNMGYANMGFDVFYDIDDFRNAEIFHGYISDRSLTREIIERYEEQKAINDKQPVFSFSVSVQNHITDMGVVDKTSTENECDEIEVSVTNQNISDSVQEDIRKYINGIDESVQALEELIAYFEKREEDTMIVFFGDHAPGMATTICGSDEWSGDEYYYRTPYLIWTNYDNDYVSYGDMNISYLSSVLIEYLNMPKPKQYFVNRYLREKYPINTRVEMSENMRDNAGIMQDALMISYYVYHNFPQDENALLFWHTYD